MYTPSAWLKTVLVACGIPPRRGLLCWLCLVSHLVGVGHEPSTGHTTNQAARYVYHADANRKFTLTRGRCVYILLLIPACQGPPVMIPVRVPDGDTGDEIQVILSLESEFEVALANRQP